MKNTQQEFYKTFIQEEGYIEKNINGFWLVQQFNPVLGKTIIALYSPEAFEGYKNFKPSIKWKKHKKKIKKQLFKEKKLPYRGFYAGIGEDYKKAADAQKTEAEINRRIREAKAKCYNKVIHEETKG